MEAFAAKRRAIRLLEWGLSLALPRVCLACKGLSAPGRSLCAPCRNTILTESVKPELPDGTRSLQVGARHGGTVRTLVHGLKYDGLRSARKDLVDLMVGRGVALPEGGILVPVPVTSARRRERGYNQAEQIALELGARLGAPVSRNFLVRTGFRGSQTRRSGDERREALEGMFAPGKGFRKDVVPVLVDDVLTTGATLSACAAICLHGGVSEVHAVCAAWAGEA